LKRQRKQKYVTRRTLKYYRDEEVGGLREASIKFISQKIPDDDEFFAKTKSLELVYKVQYWFIQGSQ